MVVTDTLAKQRYGSAPSWQRPLLMILAAVIGASFLAWVIWAAWLHGTPDVESELVGFTVQSDHQVEVTLAVTLHNDVEASCRLTAYSEDHANVGELSLTPDDGTNTVTIRTERRATSVESPGCTTPDQQRPR